MSLGNERDNGPRPGEGPADMGKVEFDAINNEKITLFFARARGPHCVNPYCAFVRFRLFQPSSLIAASAASDK